MRNRDAKHTGANGEIRYVRFSGDFKHSLGQKAAVFFFAEDLICFFILLPAVLLTLFILKANTAAFLTTPLLLAGFFLFTFLRLKPIRLWKSILLTAASAAALCSVFVFFGNYASAAVIFFAMIESLVKTGQNFARLYEMTVNRDGKVKMPFYRKKEPGDRSRREDAPSPAYFGNNTVIFSGILILVTYLTALGFGFSGLALFCILDFAAVFTLMLIYGQKSGAYCLSLWDRLSKTEDAAGGGKAEKAGSALLTFFTAVGSGVIALVLFLIAALSGNFQIDNAFIGYLMHAFNGRPTPIKPPDTVPQPVKPETGNPLEQLMKQPPKNSPAAEIVKNVLIAVLWCVVVLAAVFFIAAVGSAIIRFYRKLNMNVNEESKSLLTAKNAAEKIGLRFTPGKRRRGIFRSGNRSAIRRLFFLHIRRRRGRTVKKSDTPFELGREIKDGSDMNKAAELYEKARYSNNDCGDADVKEMKRALKPNR